MSSPRPKSPRPPVSSKKDEKEESFWDKIGTLGRKKRIKEGIALDSSYIITITMEIEITEVLNSTP
ncbi:hypothetical protein E2986_11226 [Frieseomelitta varia]|uniref:Uncharacterized protein n=1 Tax=Frieseomelitta varia TaxID=561572 RepID=A0A833VJE2_9HYME|nr:hypothetical protein E2986_11226 [Frieseomelitta varia]